jgi:hypothetical protein
VKSGDVVNCLGDGDRQTISYRGECERASQVNIEIKSEKKNKLHRKETFFKLFNRNFLTNFLMISDFRWLIYQEKPELKTKKPKKLIISNRKN